MEYLEAYAGRGVLAARLIKLALVALGVAAMVGSSYYVFFRNWREERQARQFLELVMERRYEDAYSMWGCSVEEPCRYYPFGEFLEDWGPEAPFKFLRQYDLIRSYTQPNGVIIRVAVNGSEYDPLFVESDPAKISFAPN